MPTGVFPRTETHNRALSKAKMGNKSRSGLPHTEETKRKMHEIMSKKYGNGKHPLKGKKRDKTIGQKISAAKMGHKHSEATKRNMSKAKLGKYCGCSNPSWKGGTTPLQKQIRNSFKYQQWRQDVFLRDDFICQKCGAKGGKLNVHHIKPFSQLLLEAKQYLPLLDWHEACLFYVPMWDIDNGITLCRQCHKRGRHGDYNISAHES